MTTDDTDTLSPAEQAYHDSRGESGLPEAEPAPETPAAEPEKPADKPAAAPAADKTAHDGEDERPDGTLVPYGVLKEARKEARELRERLAFLQGQQSAQQKPADQPKPADGQQANAEPDIDKDPVGWLKWRKSEDARVASEAKQQQEYQAQTERVASIGRAHAQEFVKTQPNYFDTQGADGKTIQGSYTYLRERAIERLTDRFPDANPGQIKQLVDQHELNLILECRDSGRNVAQVVHDMAVQQGWKLPDAPKTPPAGPTEAERIAALEKAQAGGKSLSQAAGGGGEPELTVEAIGKMSEEEFNALPKAKLKKLMGG